MRNSKKAQGSQRRLAWRLGSSCFGCPGSSCFGCPCDSAVFSCCGWPAQRSHLEPKFKSRMWGIKKTWHLKFERPRLDLWGAAVSAALATQQSSAVAAGLLKGLTMSHLEPKVQSHTRGKKKLAFET